MGRVQWNKIWPVFFLVFLSVGLFLKNLHPGQYLLGWDSTTPELNFSLNFSRIIFGVWQEYRGLGTLDGMAHTANIVHWLVTFLLSKVLPVTSVRYIFQLFAHFIGGVGAYFLLRDWITPYLHQKKRAPIFPQLLSLLGSAFYLPNFYTIQMFYLPLELFSVHYALFPWGLWSLLRYFHSGQRSALLVLLGINVLGISQAHVPTVVIPYAVVLVIFSLHFLLTGQKTKDSVFRVVLAGLIVFAANALWVLPYLYSVPTKSAEISWSKQNRLGTAGIFSRNYARSDLYSVTTLGGFNLDYNDWDLESKEFVSVMAPWQEWYRSPMYVALALIFFGLSVWGVVAAFQLAAREKETVWWPYLLAWFVALMMVGTKIPLIGAASAALRHQFPLFGQIFRFTFTKFSIFYVLFQSLFVVVGAYFLLRLLSRRRWLLPKWWLQRLVLVLLIVGTVVLARPAFQGHFFYRSLFVTVPEEYFSLFVYLENNLPSARLVDFPINSLWGWLTNTREWGYRGSGFTWQAIRQPVVNRSFDPWSKTNETLFLQLNHALYSQDTERFMNTLRKFHANYLLMDRSIFHPGNYDEALFYQETDAFFTQIPEIRETQRFGQLALYGVAGVGGKELVAPAVAIGVANYPASYTTKDAVFHLYGPYFADGDGLEFPFADLQQENLSEPRLENESLILSFAGSGRRLSFPAFSETQPVVSAVISQHKNALPLTLPRVTLTVAMQVPEVRLQSGVVSARQTAWDLSLPNQGRDYFVSVNNWVTKTGLFGSELPTKQHISLSTRTDNSLLAFDSEVTTVRDITETYRQQAGEACVVNKGPFTKFVSLPIPTPTSVGLSEAEPALLAMVADYQVLGDGVANVCIRDLTTGLCINETLERLASSREGWQTISTAVPLQPDGSYAVDLLGCEYQAGAWQQFTYDAVWFQYYPFAGERTIPTRAVFQQFDQDLARVSDREVFQTETVISIPLGKEAEFVINHDGQKQRLVDTATNCAVGEKGGIEKRVLADGVEYLAADGAVICDMYLLPEIDESLQYLFHAGGENSTGSGLKLFLLNPSNKRFDLETVSGTGQFEWWQTVYPTTNRYFPDEGFFTLSVNGETFGREQNRTLLKTVEFYPLPLDWLTQVMTGDVDQATRHFETVILSQRQWNPTFYTVRVRVQSEQGLLVLPQSFDKGWVALTAFRQPQHTLYNGWANAWLLPSGEYRVVLLYWPQLLSFLGYGLLIGAAVWLLKQRFSMLH